MSFGYLPTPIYITIFTSFSIVLFIYSVKVFNKLGKIMVIGGLAFGLELLGLVSIKIIREYFREAENLIGIIGIMSEVFLVIGIGSLLITVWRKTKEDQHKRKVVIVQMSILAILLIALVLVPRLLR